MNYIHETAIIDENVIIGNNVTIWHFSHILSGSVIGDNCVIGQNVMIGPDVRVGKRCKIQNNVSIYKGVEIDEDVFCGPSCVFTNVINPRAFINRKDEFKKTKVEKGSSIGANATIICGCKIGEYALVGAGAVVTKDVLNHAIVIGNPAKRTGWVSTNGETLGDKLICSSTGESFYELKGKLYKKQTQIIKK